MPIPRLFVIAVAGAAAFGIAHGQSPERLAAIAQSFADRGLFSGTVLVARGDQVLLDRGWGLASQEWQVSNAPGVKYLLASVSKQFTAAALLRLVDQGRLGPDDALSRHLSGLPAAWSAVTVRQLLPVRTVFLYRRGKQNRPTPTPTPTPSERPFRTCLPD